MTTHITQEKSTAIAEHYALPLYIRWQTIFNAAIQHHIDTHTSPDRAALINRLSAQWAALDPADPFRADVGMAVDALADDAQPYDQQALELCEACGWKTLIPGDGCLNCLRAVPQAQPMGDLNRSAQGDRVEIETI